ncbi:MAG: RcpC/CpaB family pilus assembly protein [Dehalococcoidia bacterium]
MDVRLLAGLLLVAVAVAGGITLWRQAQITAPVVVAVRDIPAGQVIESGDLGLADARLEGPLASLAFGEAELASIVGRTATAPIHAGALVLRADLGSGPVIGPNDVAVTVPVKADAVYARLRRGDEVAVMATSDKGKPQSLTVALLERATVYDVAIESSRVSLGGGSDEQDGRLTNVTLLIPRSEAERVAHAVVNAELTLLLLAPAQSGGSQP